MLSRFWPHTHSLVQALFVGVLSLFILACTCSGLAVYVALVGALPLLVCYVSMGAVMDQIEPTDSTPMRWVRLLGWLQIGIVPARFVLMSQQQGANVLAYVMAALHAIILIIAGVECIWLIATNIRDHFRAAERVANFYEGLGFVDNRGFTGDDEDEEEVDENDDEIATADTDADTGNWAEDATDETGNDDPPEATR